MLQTTDKGAVRIGKGAKNFFNEHIKMSHEMSKRLDDIKV